MSAQLLVAGLIGALLWLDRYQFLQIMVSRPIVAATIVGVVVGSAEAGLSLGVIYELMWMNRPPVGGYIPPDSCYSGVLGAAVCGVVAQKTHIDLQVLALIVFLLTIPTAYLGSKLDYQLRKQLGIIAVKAENSAVRDLKLGFTPFFLQSLITGFVFAAVTLIPLMFIYTYAVTELVNFIPEQMYRSLKLTYCIIPALLALELIGDLYDARSVFLFGTGLVVSLTAGFLF